MYLAFRCSRCRSSQCGWPSFLKMFSLCGVEVCTEIFLPVTKDCWLCFSNGRGDSVRVPRTITAVIPAGQRADGCCPACLAHQGCKVPFIYLFNFYICSYWWWTCSFNVVFFTNKFLYHCQLRTCMTHMQHLSLSWWMFGQPACWDFHGHCNCDKSAGLLIKRLQIRILAGAAGEFSSPESILCADSYMVSIPPLSYHSGR